MEANVQEALRAKAYAEKHFGERDFAGAKSYALKAQTLCPDLDGISQMVATFGVYTASELRFNGELDLYAILGLDPSADKGKVKKQYKKMAVLLHPDKNRCVGSDGAFKLISEAWTILSDHVKRSMYDQRRNASVLHASSGVDFSKSSVVSSHHRNVTFWTVCTSCHVQYEYLRKYVNKKLSCKNCRGVFIAVETGAAPASGSYPYVAENGHGGSTYIPTTSVYGANNGLSGHHSGHLSNVTIQWDTYPGTQGAVLDPNGFSMFNNASRHVDEKSNREKVKVRVRKTAVNTVSNGYNERPISKPGRPAKKRKVDAAGTCQRGIKEMLMQEAKATNGDGNMKQNSKLSSPIENCAKRVSPAPVFDTRQLFIDKARTEIRKKLEQMRLASASAAAAQVEKQRKALAKVDKAGEAPKKLTPELKKSVSMSITVPDSDFHDFDKDRTEDCFKPKQIWALYDEEDGMPRLYCLIREVISLKPFRIYIGYLSSKTDTEFGSVNWLDSGFTKSCGNFRVFNSEIVEQVNIFSHLLSREKAGRGGCVRLYPRSGDIWAVYRNWSTDWNRTTPDEVRHQYQMVEVLDDYSEELGVCVTPLVKLDGYKTVYQRNKDEVRWIPRREMLRFSHQVPSCLLKGEAFNLPEDCWDLDPAATPDELLQGVTQVKNEANCNLADNPDVQCQSNSNGHEEANLAEADMSISRLDNCDQDASVMGNHCQVKITSDEQFQSETNDHEEAKLAQAEMSVSRLDDCDQDASVMGNHWQVRTNSESHNELPLSETDVLAQLSESYMDYFD